MFSRETVAVLVTLLFGAVTCQNCPDGWVSFENSCYLFADTPGVHFTEAEHYCRQHGGHLVTVETSLENSFLKTFMHRISGPSFWMGLTDELVEGVWVWSSDKSPATFTDWRPGEPNNNCDGGQDCAYFSKDAGKWDDLNCRNNLVPLCEKSM